MVSSIPFFLGNDTIFGALQILLFTPANRPGRKALSAAMMEYLASFARTGNPNPPGSSLPAWQPWSNEAGTMKALVFDAQRRRPLAVRSRPRSSPTRRCSRPRTWTSWSRCAAMCSGTWTR